MVKTSQRQPITANPIKYMLICSLNSIYVVSFA
jgi:hypothetical protein